MSEKLKKKEVKTFFNSGIYIIDPDIKKFFQKKKFIHMTDVINLLIEKKRK